MRSFLFCLFLLFAVVFTFNASESLADGADKPLMVIRLDGTPVNYETSLDKAIKMAVAKKPEVVFDVVAVAAETMDRNTNEKSLQETKFFAEKVAEQIKNSGVSADMVKVSFKQNKLTKINEIEIFVQ